MPATTGTASASIPTTVAPPAEYTPPGTVVLFNVPESVVLIVPFSVTTLPGTLGEGDGDGSG